MKKILSIVTALAISASASQGSKYVSLGATSVDADIFGTGLVYSLNLGGKKVFDNNVFLGADLLFEYGSLEKNSQTIDAVGYGGNINLGYQYKDLGVFVLGSALLESIDNISTAGFGFGGGIEYTPWEHVGFGVKYVQYSMTTELVGVDYDRSGVKGYINFLY